MSEETEMDVEHSRLEESVIPAPSPSEGVEQLLSRIEGHRSNAHTADLDEAAKGVAAAYRSLLAESQNDKESIMALGRSYDSMRAERVKMEAVVSLAKQIPVRYSTTAMSIMMGAQFMKDLHYALVALAAMGKKA